MSQVNQEGYDQALQQISYLYDSGARLMAVQGPAGTPAKIVNVHAPIGQKVVAWCAKRPNVMPTIPDTIPANSNETLMSSQIKPTVPTRTVGQGAEYMIEGMYTFLFTLPLGRQDNLDMGHMPLGVDPFTAKPYQITPGTYDATWLGSESLPASTLPTAVVDKSGVKPS
jgi:hypothetical protein